MSGKIYLLMIIILQIRGFPGFMQKKLIFTPFINSFILFHVEI